MKAVYSQLSPSIPTLYEILALPVPTEGIVKVVVGFTSSETNPEVEVIPHTPEDRPGQGIALVYQFLDHAALSQFTDRERNEYLLDRYHAGLQICA